MGIEIGLGPVCGHKNFRTPCPRRGGCAVRAGLIFRLKLSFESVNVHCVDRILDNTVNFVNVIFDYTVNIPIKTAEQIEFAEIFERLEKAFNMSKAEVARALLIERSYVSMLIKGQRTPGSRTLESMRVLEKKMLAERTSEMSEKAAEGGSELNRLFNQLTELERTDRATFTVARKMIESLAPVSSKPASASSKLLKKAADSVRKPDSK